MKTVFSAYSMKVLYTYVLYTSSQSIFHISNYCSEHFMEKQLKAPEICFKKHVFRPNYQKTVFRQKLNVFSRREYYFKNNFQLGPKYFSLE